MSEDLPGVSRRKRIVIDEADLAPEAPAAPQAPPAPAAQLPAAPPVPPSPRAPTPPPAQAGQPAADPRPPRPPAPAPPAVPAVPKLPHPANKSPVLGSYCTGCGSPVHSEAVVCPRCGVPTAGAAQATNAAMTVALNSKSTAAAILLSLLFTGAGHWYVGRVGRGFAFLGAAIVSGILIIAIVGIFLLPVVWAWAAIDANNCARKHNAELMRQAGMPTMPPTLNA